MTAQEIINAINVLTNFVNSCKYGGLNPIRDDYHYQAYVNAIDKITELTNLLPIITPNAHTN